MKALHVPALVALAIQLSACGADVVGSAATTAELQAKQAQQAMAQASQVQGRVEAAMKGAEAAASQAAGQ